MITIYYYAGAIIIMTVTSVVAEILETRRNLLNIRAMAMYECPVNVICPSGHKGESEDGVFLQKKSSQLVPGDIIEITNGMKMPCDCVLLSGSAIVNEAMLTGESIPVLKTSLPYLNDIYNPDEDKKYTIYSGTEVIQARQTGDAQCSRTSCKNWLLHCERIPCQVILFPKESKFSFYSDSYKFIAVMFAMSFVGMTMQ